MMTGDTEEAEEAEEEDTPVLAQDPLIVVVDVEGANRQIVI